MSIEHPDDYSSAPVGAGEPYAAPAPRYYRDGVEITREEYDRQHEANRRAYQAGATRAPRLEQVWPAPADCAGAQHAKQPKVLVVPEGCTLIAHGAGEALDAYDVVHVHGRLEIPEYNGRLMRTRVTLFGNARADRQGAAPGRYPHHPHPARAWSDSGPM